MMASENIIANLMAHLRAIVRDDFDDAPAQVQGFVLRALDGGRYISDAPLCTDQTAEDCLDAVKFDGYPALAKAGYTLARRDYQPVNEALAEKFFHCIEQQRSRPFARCEELAGDSLALLGMADGLRVIAHTAQEKHEGLNSAKAWVRELLEERGGRDGKLTRARLLASDLLDEQGRFGRKLAQSGDAETAVFDLCLWQTWPDILRNVEHPDAPKRQALLKYLLTAPGPKSGELLQAAVWLCAINVLTNEIAAAAVPDSNQVARILVETQGSFRRWRWESKATRKDVMPARWLIDKEADIQAFLLAVLYPYFVDQLEDEQYLQGFGLRQGRFDFAISSLGLIIEVKVMRKTGDINGIEADIADDLALYFKEGNPFKEMIVYIYDDRDKPEPENYPAIRDALKRRGDRIIDVVIVPRPSMIPDRKCRQ